ncbi:hypothetical protein CC86DRAFT_395980 [Ophiobolus disseminans]|uniref:SMP-30/Gluconolactonase/LRE-like region domain-containing protein n=1 Tax=Ophiobolus disseminans TaxID=1469910 RepID=A0A6A6ZSD9_9PLEO|nr:hypothetical protein CC86DRAFT_395980 [Ophiobolus disseminans]
MYSSALATALSVLAVTSAANIPRQVANTTTQIAQLGGWVECLAVRSNGHLLATRLDVPELWTVDPTTKTTAKIATFPNALGLTGVAEIAPDVFAVVAGNFSTTAFTIGNGSWSVWKIDFTGATPKQTLLKAIPEAGFLLGATAFNNDTAFIADAGNGALYRISITTGEYEVVLQDPTMKAPDGSFIPEGIHGVRYIPQTGSVFFTNTFGSTFNKFDVNRTSGKPIVFSGVTTITTKVETPEDLAVIEGTAFIMSLNGGGIFRVTPDGKSTKIVDVTSGSTVAIGRGTTDARTLYFANSSGTISAVSSPL